MNNDFISESTKPKRNLNFTSGVYEDKVYEPKEYIPYKSDIEKLQEEERNTRIISNTINGKPIQANKKNKAVKVITRIIAGLTAGAAFITIGVFIAKHKDKIKELIGDIGAEPTVGVDLYGYYPGQPNPELEADKEAARLQDEEEKKLYDFQTNYVDDINNGEYDDYIMGGK